MALTYRDLMKQIKMLEDEQMDEIATVYDEKSDKHSMVIKFEITNADSELGENYPILTV